MTTRLVKSLVDEQLDELPEHLATPAGQIRMVFKGLTTQDAMHQAALAGIENPACWGWRGIMCGMCTLTYEVRA